MKKVVVFLASALLLATPMMAAAAGGIIGDCSDCHTMHNSMQGVAVAQVGTSGTVSATPIQNLLKFDCIACHANPDATGKLWSLPGGSVVPQVSQPTDDNLAAGNFRYSTSSDRKGHNVIDLTPADGSNAGDILDVATYGAPPGNAHADHHGLDAGVFSVTAPFDQFTCAGARGCHGTRSQVLPGATADYDGNASTPNTWDGQRRTGIAAISGAHHNSFDGAKDGLQADGVTSGLYSGESAHDGAIVAAGYRFIPGLFGYGNTVDRWQNVNSTDHNEYYGSTATAVGAGAGCGVCHQEGTAGTDALGNPVGGFSSRAATTSYLKVPNNSMSGFCATCHGVFHSMGSENGTSGAFLRHPSDWVIPASGEYAAYTSYDITAPVARPTVYTAASGTVTPGTDMVMCLSCHEAHATQYDFMLRFNYGTYTGADGLYDGSGTMDAGAYGSIGAATAQGGCLACHTTKGVLPENR